MFRWWAEQLLRVFIFPRRGLRRSVKATGKCDAVAEDLRELRFNCAVRLIRLASAQEKHNKRFYMWDKKAETCRLYGLHYSSTM